MASSGTLSNFHRHQGNNIAAEIGNQEEESRKPVRANIVWFNALGFLAMHLLGMYGLWFACSVDRFPTVMWAFFLTISAGQGLMIGAHRLYSHRSFKATRGLRLMLIVLQTIAGQNCMYIWVRDHRQHHKYSDMDADPHNASRSFFFSHCGWLMVRKHPEVIAKGKNIDLSDLEGDPIVMFQKKYYKPLYVLLAVIFPVGTPIIFWNETLLNSIMIAFFARYVLLLNITWLVNSAAHMFGTRPYNKRIIPADCDTIAFLTLGEGWHNYHHAFPWDYRAAEYGRYFGSMTRIINILELFGLAYDLKEASPNAIMKRVLEGGDGSHPVWGFGDKDMDKKTLEELCGESPSHSNKLVNLGFCNALSAEMDRGRDNSEARVSDIELIPRSLTMTDKPEKKSGNLKHQVRVTSWLHKQEYGDTDVTRLRDIAMVTYKQEKPKNMTTDSVGEISDVGAIL